MRTKDETLRLLQEGFIRDADGTVYWEHDDFGSIACSPNLLESLDPKVLEVLKTFPTTTPLVLLDAAAIWGTYVIDSPARLADDGYAADERAAYWTEVYEEALEQLMDDEKYPELTESDLREIATRAEGEQEAGAHSMKETPETGDPALD